MLAARRGHSSAGTACRPVRPVASGGPALRTGALAGQRGYSLIDLLMVVALISIVAGMAVPATGSAVAGHRFRADSQAISQMVGLAKMRASAGFTRARVRANLTTNSYVLEIWEKDLDTCATCGAWVIEGGEMRASQGVTFSYDSLVTPPPNTQQAIGFSPACRAGIVAASAAIANTACIVFNSRGLPVDGAGVLFGRHALYLTDGAVVSATTVTLTPRIRRWLSPLRAVNWREQL